ncbi:hypothetical protein CHU98_g6568 [Xylaria longipes]|nr:hypothetical protein CHU98_g6568 [Xylaria longipes]
MLEYPPHRQLVLNGKVALSHARHHQEALQLVAANIWLRWRPRARDPDRGAQPDEAVRLAHASKPEGIAIGHEAVIHDGPACIETYARRWLAGRQGRGGNSDGKGLIELRETQGA